ncbi:MAG: T9SS type A sorting domain-containing protein [Cytophagaceae bacterium]
MYSDTIFIRAMVTGIDTCEYLITSVKNLQLTEKVMFYPNPFNASLTVQFNADLNNVDLIICNIYGEKVKSVLNVSGNRTKVDRGTLQSGVYFIEVIQNSRIIATEKLIITD